MTNNRIKTKYKHTFTKKGEKKATNKETPKKQHRLDPEQNSNKQTQKKNYIR